MRKGQLAIVCKVWTEAVLLLGVLDRRGFIFNGFKGQESWDGDDTTYVINQRSKRVECVTKQQAEEAGCKIAYCKELYR